jgi:hypothetical protein
MEQLGHKGNEGQKSIKHLFDINAEEVENQYPHSIYGESLSFDKEHTFSAHKKEKIIDQFVSPGGKEFFKITRKPEIQFLTSQLLGGVINISPIYIDEHGEYFSKKVNFQENILDAAIGLFILNVIANDWDHEIGNRKNYENGSFFDFSQSKIALEDAQRNQDEKTVIQNTWHSLEEIKQQLLRFVESKNIKVTQEEITNEVKKQLFTKLTTLLDFISSENTIKEMYKKIGYFEYYQNGLLEPKELQAILTQKITTILKEIKDK